MESKERHRLEDLDEAIAKRQEVEGRVAYATDHPLLSWSPILRKHKGPCPKVACLGCHNYDPERSLSYSCLIKGNSREDPTRKASCCYAIAKGQTRLKTKGQTRLKRPSPDTHGLMGERGPP